ncbi:GSCOCT00013996001.2-RA-CDS [Cotesia congregata]|uniref:Venom protein 25 n=1 Tax=Cotesia congregata TaxID=51543 RepID=A0A8J2EC57_COTCN|nr:GSCOCT00013996001.2-RA-CDS [Cotesia congregata]CAG5075151.1 Putative venom protein 25 [Cotesia congregata]
MLYFVKVLLLSIAVTTYFIPDVETCFRKCPDYINTLKGNENRERFITYLSDSLKLRDLALIGTRYSASYITYIPRYKTQDRPIDLQLISGVRVLDSAVWSSSDEFYLYKWAKYLMTFDEFLGPINSFLTANPGEFVITLIHEEHKRGADVTKSNCEIVRSYCSLSNGHRIVTNWSLEDTIGQHRGKILLAGLDSSFDDCALSIASNCQVQDTETSVDSSSKIEDKWIDIQKFHDRSYRKDSGHCFVNFMADKPDTNTWKMAVKGGTSTRNGCEAPLNVRMASYFSNPHRALIMVMADYVTQNLIDSILSSNFKGDTFYTMYVNNSDVIKISFTVFPLSKYFLMVKE